MANMKRKYGNMDPGVNEILLRITAACNQRCVFCNTDGMDFQMSVKDVHRECRQLDRETVYPILTGGEPTLHSDCVLIINLLKEMGFRNIGIQTNAMKFSRMRYAAEAAEAGLEFAIVSLHGATPEMSDLITDCPGGFDNTWKGIQNLIACGVEVIINHVLNNENYRHVASFVEMINKKLYENVEGSSYSGILSLSLVQPFGKALERFEIVPMLKDVAPFFVAAMKRCAELGVEVVNPGCGIPVCLTPGFEHCSSEASLIRKDAVGVRTISANSERKVKGPDCEMCAYDGVCLGIWREYAEAYGFEELKPVR